MRVLLYLLQKEFLQLSRNRAVVRMLFISPIIQLLLLPLAANFEVKNVNLAVVDFDRSSYSQKMINKVLSSGYFKLIEFGVSYDRAFSLIEKDKADIILEIPRGFESNMVSEQTQKVLMSVNAINGIKALVGSGYLNSILADFNADIRVELANRQTIPASPVIQSTQDYWYNPNMTYTWFMVPGILVMLLTLVSGNLASSNIVKEKEIGTIEQINVTPIKKHLFILGKLIPFWVLGNIIFTIGLLVARFAYGIHPLGSLWLLYLFLAVYLVAMLGFGLLISTYSATQQQAHALTFFFVMIFNLMSGLYTSIDSMPHWAQVITYFIPIKYFIEVIRMIVLKGSNLNNIISHLAVVLAMGIVLNLWAILNYRKTRN
jgi:ABC-2 type transport system permease protein